MDLQSLLESRYSPKSFKIKQNAKVSIDVSCDLNILSSARRDIVYVRIRGNENNFKFDKDSLHYDLLIEQVNNELVDGDEDLFLNVYIPDSYQCSSAFPVELELVLHGDSNCKSEHKSLDTVDVLCFDNSRLEILARNLFLCAKDSAHISAKYGGGILESDNRGKNSIISISK